MLIMLIMHAEIIQRMVALVYDIFKRHFKIYDAAGRRRGLQNKIIIRVRQSEWIICSPKNILNTVFVL